MMKRKKKRRRKKKRKRAAFQSMKAKQKRLLGCEPAPKRLDIELALAGANNKNSCSQNKEGEIECVRKPSKGEKELWGRWRRRWSLQCGEPSQGMEELHLLPSSYVQQMACL